MWSAVGAVRAAHVAGSTGGEVRVTLVSGDDLVIRPRLYADAPAELRVP